jgi:DNA-directed RNA polymerase beta' subunit
MIHEEIDKITIQCNTKQQEQKFEQLEMEYLLCNTNSRKYIIELTRKIESMEFFLTY